MNRIYASMWTEEELQQLRDLYPHIPTVRLAEIIPHSRQAIGYKAKQLGLKKTPEAKLMAYHEAKERHSAGRSDVMGDYCSNGHRWDWLKRTYKAYKN